MHSMTTRTVHIIHILLLSAFFAGTALSWRALPERIPTHFTGTGVPTTWSRSGLVAWFALPILATVLALFLHGLAVLARRSLSLWNFPNKDKLLRLSPDARRSVLERLERINAVGGILATILFISIQVGIYQTATGRTDGLPWYSHAVIIGAIVLMTGGAIVEAVRIGGVVERLVEGEGEAAEQSL
jgi:uncharacterized membrane protein